jgi:hypothetical protein
MNESTKDLRRFLKMLDEADTNVNDWEAEFIASNLDADFFSPKQRQSIEQMMETYGKRIGWY